ncbi:hypothetical protein GCM10027059_37040 [Myceligenerans halotolerans]
MTRAFDVVPEPVPEREGEPDVGAGVHDLGPGLDEPVHLVVLGLVQHHPHAVACDDVGGLCRGVDADQARERLVQVPARHVEPDGADHGRARPRGVDPAGGEPLPDDLGQVRVHPEAAPEGVVPVRVVAVVLPDDEQAGALELGEDLAGALVVGEMGGSGCGDDAFAGDAQEQVALLRREGGEDLSGDVRRERRHTGRHATDGRVAVAGRAEPARGQHGGGAPAVRLPGHGVEHLPVGAAGVGGDELVALGLAQPEQVAAQEGEVAQELRDEPGQREVPAAQQQQAQRLGGRVEAVIDPVQGRGGQRVRVVDHDQRPFRRGVTPGARAVHDPGEPGRRPVGAGRDPGRPAGPRPRAVPQPPGDTHRLAGPDGCHHEGHGAGGGVVEVLPEPGAGNVHARDVRYGRRARHRRGS